MQALSLRSQVVIVLMLALLVAATRGHHFASISHLPSATWAVCFLAGVYLRSRWFFVALLLEVVLLDLSASGWGSRDSYCLSSAYALLLPAYGSLWLAGRWYAGQHREQLSTLLPLAVSLLLGALVCELLSSGGFYLFSGRFAEPQLGEFAARVVLYFPPTLTTLLGYVAMAAALHLGCQQVRPAIVKQEGIAHDG